MSCDCQKGMTFREWVLFLVPTFTFVAIGVLAGERLAGIQHGKPYTDNQLSWFMIGFTPIGYFGVLVGFYLSHRHGGRDVE